LFCILTSGRLYGELYGESKFTNSIGNWLVRNNQEVILVGSRLGRVEIKKLSKFNIEDKKNKYQKKTGAKNISYIIYMLSRFFVSFLWILKIISIHRKTPIKLIHSQDSGYAGLASLFAGKILRVPVVISSHGIRHKTLESFLKSKFNKILLKVEKNIDLFTINRADAIIAVNPATKKYYEKLTKKNIEYIPIPIKVKNYGFSEKNRELIRNEFAIETKIKVIGYVGRLSAEKNIATLLNSFVTVTPNNFLKLMLVGTGPTELELRNLVKKNNIANNVIFCGSRNDVERIISAFDIFVLPSFTEGMPTAVLEAMAASRAIICSDIPAHQDLVEHNKDALIVDPHKKEQLTQAIQQLCSNDSLKEKLGNNARLKVAQYDEELIFPKVLELYQKIIDKKRRLDKRR